MTDDPTDAFLPTGPGVTSFPVTIAATGPVLVAGSGGPTSQEEADLVNPAAGNYIVDAHGFNLPAGTADFTLFSWLLGSASAGNMTVTGLPNPTIVRVDP